MNGVSVVGIGECGTRVALELAADFDLGLFGELLELTSLPAPKFKFLLKFKWDTKKTNSISDKVIPYFFIGDFNQSNKSYVDARKAYEIVKYVRANNHTNANEILKALQSTKKLSLLEFDKDDLPKINKLKGRQDGVPRLEMLDFYDEDGLLMAPDGAGGYQYLSEAVTDSNTNMLTSLKDRPSRILFGILGTGGGSGAGAITSILSRDPLKTSRLSLAIAVFPNEGENSHFCNSGRFITRYLSKDVKDRFDKMFLFSNRSARIALNCISDPAKFSEMTEQKLVNTYISKVVFCMSAINSGEMDVKSGCAFDTLDSKRYLPELAAVSLASSNNNEQFDELFLRAIAPLKIYDDSLSGISVTVGLNVTSVSAIEKSLKGIYSTIHDQEDKERTIEQVEKLNKITGFYRPIKSVRAFYLCKEESSIISMTRSVSRIADFLNALSEGTIEFVCAGLINSSLQEDILFLVIDSGTNADIIDSLYQYSLTSFFNKDSEKANQFIKTLQTGLVKIRDTKNISEGLSEIENIKKDLTDQLSNINQAPSLSAIREYISEEQKAFLSVCEFLPEELNDEASTYYLTADNYIIACTKLLFSMQSPANSNIHEIDDDAGPAY
jgi:hypothetical protein